MIPGLIRWSARNLLLVFVGTLALTGGGLYAIGRVSLDAIPDLSDTR
jgi:Cu(I)/Ag(I) efflux system membrane protein CusA/SilA